MASKSGSDQLTTDIIARNAKEFDVSRVKIFLMAFMKMPHARVKNTTKDAYGDSEKVIRELLRTYTWQHQPSVQDFADFLMAANLKTEQEIEELLGVTPNEYVNDLSEPNKKSYLQEWELAFITLKTGPTAIKTLAGRNVTKFPKAEVDNADYDHRNDGWGFAFEVLRIYGNKTKDSRKALWDLFNDNKDLVDVEDRDLQSIFGVLQNKENTPADSVKNCCGDQQNLARDRKRSDNSGEPEIKRPRKDCASEECPVTCRCPYSSTDDKEICEVKIKTITDPFTKKDFQYYQGEKCKQHKKMVLVDHPFNGQAPDRTEHEKKLVELMVASSPEIVSCMMPDGLCNEEDFTENYKRFKYNEIVEKTKPFTKNAREVVIAVVDTGVCEDHPKLKNKMLPGHSHNFVSGAHKDFSESDLRKDGSNHGTMVAGIIALRGPDNVKMVNHKVLPIQGRGQLKDMVTALQYIKGRRKEEKVDIINISMGSEKVVREDNVLHDLNKEIDDLAQNTVIIAAPGNEAAVEPDNIMWPARHGSVISVGAHRADGFYSKMTSVGERVDIHCPGEKVVSTRSFSSCDQKREIMYCVKSGTSFSAPHATAVAAHILNAVEAKCYQEARRNGEDEESAKKIGKEERAKLCKSSTMKDVLIKMTNQHQMTYQNKDNEKTLYAYKKLFENIDDNLFQMCNINLGYGNESDMDCS